MLRTTIAKTVGWNKAWKYRHLIDSKWCDGYKNISAESRRRLCDKILESDPTSILEIGCGMGANLKVLHSIEPQLELYGVDISPYIIQKALEWLPPSIVIYEGSFEDLHTIIKPFDVVFTSDSFIYAKHKTDALLGMTKIGKRVLLYEWRQILEVK